MCCLGGRWALSCGGLPVPTGIDRTIAIYDHFWERLTPEERNDPWWSSDNDQSWTAFF
jgi:hypothetical protein